MTMRFSILIKSIVHLEAVIKYDWSDQVRSEIQSKLDLAKRELDKITNCSPVIR